MHIQHNIVAHLHNVHTLAIVPTWYYLTRRRCICFFTWSARYVRQILTKSRLCRQIFIKVPSCQISRKSLQWKPRTDGRTDVTKVTSALRKKANAPNIYSCVGQPRNWMNCCITFLNLYGCTNTDPYFSIISDISFAATYYSDKWRSLNEMSLAKCLTFQIIEI
jgi:hypothetical protein